MAGQWARGISTTGPARFSGAISCERNTGRLVGDPSPMTLPEALLLDTTDHRSIHTLRCGGHARSEKRCVRLPRLRVWRRFEDLPRRLTDSSACDLERTGARRAAAIPIPIQKGLAATLGRLAEA